MRSVSDAFLRALRGSHSGPVEAYVVAPGQTGTTPTGTRVTLLGGDVQFDGGAPIRSTLDITVDGTGSFPDNASDAFAPYGNEIFVRRGIGFGGGAVEWVSLGYFRIDSVGQDEAPNGPLRVAAKDRMVGIVEYRLMTPVQFAASTTYGTIMNQLVGEVYPWATIQWDDTSNLDPIGRSIIEEEDRYAVLDSLVTSLGKIWYWDHRGILTIKNVPPSDDPVWEVNAGAQGVLVSMGRELSREGVYNGIVVSGEGLDTTTPPRAVAVDDNPDSPTYWDGSFGKVPQFYVSQFITTTSQAQTTANSLIRRKLGLPYNVDFQSIVNPALEPYDAVAIRVEGGSGYTSPRRVVQDSFTTNTTDTWGSTDSGQLWSMTVPLTNWDVASGEGTWAATSSGNAGIASLVGVEEADVDGTFTCSTPVMAAGASLSFGGMARFVDTNNYYQLRFEFNVGGSVSCKISKYTGGVFTEIAGNNPVPALTYTAGQKWQVRYRAVGTSLKIKVWPVTDPEPSDWTLAAVDADHTSGSVGLWFWRVSPNTNTGAQFHVDDFRVNAIPALAPGTEVHIIDTMTVPLSVTQPMSATTREQTVVVIGEEA